MNRKLNTTFTAALVLWGILGAGRLNAQHQSISWSTMDDIRQVTKLASSTQWETIREEKGVKLSSRWLTFGDSVKTRELAAHFVVDADFHGVLDCLMNPEKMMAWNDGVRSLDVYQQDGSTWITHTVYDIPYPLSQQDLVVKNVMIWDKQKITILLSAIPGYIEPLKNVNRQQLYFGKWELKTLENSGTEVRFSVVSFSKSGVPRFMRDPVIQNKLFNSFVRLKELSAVKALEKDRDLQTSISYL
jgi:hypothetical protein